MVVARSPLPSFNSIVVRLKGKAGRCRRRSRSTFQFHSGSIKSEIQRQQAREGGRFQFHSGSIKSREKSTYIPLCVCFNSIVVRLKGEWIPQNPGAAIWFQFHSGSIKRRYESQGYTSLIRFQFHSGSIKSWGRGWSAGELSSVSIP